MKAGGWIAAGAGWLLLAACVPLGMTSPASTAAAAATQPPAAAPVETALPASAVPALLTGTPTLFAPTSAPPGEADLRSASFTLPETGRITLKDGQWQGDGYAVWLEQWVDGVLEYNGFRDAAAIVALNAGGSGSFFYLVAWINQGGELRQLGPAVALGDRPQIESLVIWDGHVIVRGLWHWEDDPMCCPSKPQRLTYLARAEGLRLKQLESWPGSSDAPHRVSILNVEHEASGVHVWGLVTVMPFENTLVYRWLTPQGDLLAEGPLTAQPDAPDEMGGPGSFEALIPWPDAPPDAPLWLEIREPSMRDGAALALDRAWVR